MFNHVGGDSGAVRFVQAASKRLTDAGPGGGNDHCFSHTKASLTSVAATLAQEKA